MKEKIELGRIEPIEFILCSKGFYGWCRTIYMVLRKVYKDLAKLLSHGGGEDS